MIFSLSVHCTVYPPKQTINQSGFFEALHVGLFRTKSFGTREVKITKRSDFNAGNVGSFPPKLIFKILKLRGRRDGNDGDAVDGR